jgi:hypothetical protein
MQYTKKCIIDGEAHGVRPRSSDPYTQVVQECTAPKARNSKAQGASPGNMDDYKIEF